MLSSYSRLGIWAGSFMWDPRELSPLLALVLGAAPGKGAMLALMSLCTLYGKGFKTSMTLTRHTP